MKNASLNIDAGRVVGRIDGPGHLTDMVADLDTTTDPLTGEVTSVSLLVNSIFGGPGGIASGLAAVGVTSPDDSIWLAGPFLGNPPDDGRPAITFNIDSSGEVMGIEPSPFRIFLSSPPMIT